MPIDIGPDEVDEIAADLRADGQDQVADHQERDRDDPVGRVAGPDQQRYGEHGEGSRHDGGVDGRPTPGLPVDVGVVGQAADRGRHDRQDPDEDRDVGGDPLADDVEDDRDGHHTYRQIGQGRVDRVTEPGPVEEVLHRPDRPEEGGQPAVIEVAERRRPASLRVADWGDPSTDHSCTPPLAEFTRRRCHADVRKALAFVLRSTPARPTPAALPDPAAPPGRVATAGRADDPERGRDDWRRIVAVFSITSLVEGLGVSQVFSFLAPYLHEMGVPDAERVRFVGLFSALVFVVGMPLVPLWGVWADKYSRKAIIVRSCLVEAVVFAAVALSREPWQLALSLLLIGFQLGNTGVMLAGIPDGVPRARVRTGIPLFGGSGPIGSPIGPGLGGFLAS